MPEKLLTLRELSEHLQVTEEKIAALVEEGVIFGYKIGGELLRFRKEQIDAIRSEIDSRLSDADRIVVSETRRRVKERLNAFSGRNRSTAKDRIADFIYFNDFYIIATVVIIALVIVIFRG